MTNRIVDGWLIHFQTSGENGYFLHLFTEDYGLLKTSYPGGQSRKRKAHLQLFTPLWIEIKERGSRHYCVNIELKSSVTKLNDLTLCCAYYVNELIYKTIQQPETDQSLYHSYQETISCLQTSTSHGQIEKLLRRFEWTLLVSQGHVYSFSHEGNQQTKIEPHQSYLFKPGYGFYPGDNGFNGKVLLSINQSGLTDQSALKTAKLVMRQAIDYLLDYKPIQARNLVIKQPASLISQP